MAVNPPSLIVLSLEGFSTSALGCYGSSWNRTPAIDAIAASGCLWDRWIATSDHPLALLRQTAEDSSWAGPLRAQGPVELLTDVPLATPDRLGSCFDRVEAIHSPPPTESDLPMDDVVDTQLGGLVAAAIQRDRQDPTWSLLWLHSNCLTHRWDAPRDLLIADELEPVADQPAEEPELLECETQVTEEIQPLAPVFDSVMPPRLQIDGHTHPDLVTSWMRTYGCQIRLVDLLIEVLLGSLQRDDPTLILLGTSGYRLGQGGSIGHHPATLRSPDVHLPMLVSDGGPVRLPSLTPSSTLPKVLEDLASGRRSFMDPSQWCASDEDTVIETRSDRARSVLTTSRWFYVQDQDSSEHLFLKPDDVEDFNDVGRIRGDVLDQIKQRKRKQPCPPIG